MRRWTWLTVLATAALAGCSRNITPADDTGDTQDTEDTADTQDTQDTSDTGDTADTADTQDTDPFPLDCDADYTGQTPPITGGGGDDACMTDVIECGDIFLHTTEGGSTIVDNSIYGAGGFWQCNPGEVGTSANWDAAERFYEFLIPPTSTATILFDSDCGDVYVRAIRSDTPCDVAHTHNCWLPSISGNDQHIDLSNPTSSAKRYDIVVDGVDGFEGNFRLEIDCP